MASVPVSPVCEKVDDNQCVTGLLESRIEGFLPKTPDAAHAVEDTRQLSAENRGKKATRPLRKRVRTYASSLIRACAVGGRGSALRALEERAVLKVRPPSPHGLGVVDGREAAELTGGRQGGATTGTSPPLSSAISPVSLDTATAMRRGAPGAIACASGTHTLSSSSIPSPARTTNEPSRRTPA